MNTVRTRKSSTLGSQAKGVLEKQGQVARIASGISVFDVAKILTFTMPNFWFSKKYRNKQWDGRVRFLRGRLFPVGFVERVVENLVRPVEVIDLNSRCVINTDSLENFFKGADLRDYQIKAIFTGINKKIGIINLAANAGKGRCIAGILSAFPNSKFLVLAHRVDILKEINKECKKFLPPGQESFYTLSTFQSAKKLDLDEFDGVLVDECHVSASKTYYNIISQCHYAEIRLGFTATADRGDGLNFYVEAVLGRIIYTVPQQELIKRKISTKPTIHLVPFKLPFGYDDYQTAEELLVNCRERNYLIADLVKDKDEVLILFKRIRHGRLLEALIPDSAYVDGKTPKTFRDKIKEGFMAKKFKVLLASSIFDAGINLANIKTLLLAWGGKSSVALTQRIGRALRSDIGRWTFHIT